MDETFRPEPLLSALRSSGHPSGSQYAGSGYHGDIATPIYCTGILAHHLLSDKQQKICKQNITNRFVSCLEYWEETYGSAPLFPCVDGSGWQLTKDSLLALVTMFTSIDNCVSLLPEAPRISFTEWKKRISADCAPIPGDGLPDSLLKTTLGCLIGETDMQKRLADILREAALVTAPASVAALAASVLALAGVARTGSGCYPCPHRLRLSEEENHCLTLCLDRLSGLLSPDGDLLVPEDTVSLTEKAAVSVMSQGSPLVFSSLDVEDDVAFADGVRQVALGLLPKQSLPVFSHAALRTYGEEGESSVAVSGKQRYVAFFHTGNKTLSACILPAGKKPIYRITDAFSPRLSVPSHTVTSGSATPFFTTFKAGFLLFGERLYTVNGPLTDGELPLCRSYLSFAALPDDETVLWLSGLRSLCPATLENTAAAALCMTDRKGEYYFAGERHSRASLFRKANVFALGQHCNIHDSLGLVTAEEQTLHETTEGDRLLIGWHPERRRVKDGDFIARSAGAAAIGSIRRTYALAEGFLTLDALPKDILSVSAIAANRKRYTLLYNLSPDSFSWEEHVIPPKEAALLAWDR